MIKIGLGFNIQWENNITDLYCSIVTQTHLSSKLIEQLPLSDVQCKVVN